MELGKENIVSMLPVLAAHPANLPSGFSVIYILASDGKAYKKIESNAPEEIGSGGGVPDGGTTGQVLQKNSDTNGDAAWQTLEVSDVSGLSSALAGKENTITAGTTAQYWRGDKSWRDFATDVLAALAAFFTVSGDRTTFISRLRFWNRTTAQQNALTSNVAGDALFNTDTNRVSIFSSVFSGFTALFWDRVSAPNKILGRISTGVGAVEEIDVQDINFGTATLAAGSATVVVSGMSASSIVLITSIYSSTLGNNIGRLSVEKSAGQFVARLHDTSSGAIINSSLTFDYVVYI